MKITVFYDVAEGGILLLTDIRTTSHENQVFYTLILGCTGKIQSQSPMQLI